MMKIFRYISFSLLLLFVLVACTKKEDTPTERLTAYIDLWEKADFTKLFDEYVSETSKETFGKEEYIERTKKIYKDLAITNVKISFKVPEKEGEVKKTETYSFPVDIKMETTAGPIEFVKDVPLVYEEREEVKGWFINWDPSFTLPDLEKEDKIGLSVINSERGEIFDRHGQAIAINGTGVEIGVIPEKFDAKKDAEALAKTLGVSADYIHQQITQSWVKPDYFVPLKKILVAKEHEYAEVFKIPGVTTKQIGMREYPHGESFAHLVGYIGKINAEELEKLKDENYTETDFIGKRGLEQLLEKRLRGQDGLQLYIEKTEHNKERITIAEKPATNGEKIMLTVDAGQQNKTFKAMDGEAGSAAMIDPKTGEVLVLTSSPSFDPNDFVEGISATKYKKLNEDPKQPFLNRFAASYAPGSAIKPLTAAIGMEAGTLNPADGYTINGRKWQKDGSWGNFNVTRLLTPPNPVNLEKALVFSDNIYFAREALKMGRDTFVQGLEDFGYGEETPFSYPLRPSQISNDGKIGSEGQLADTSFGQGEMLMNIVHLASTFAPIINDGKMMKPVLFEEEKKAEVWKEGLLSPETAKVLQNDLRKVVSEGSAKVLNDNNVAVSGKTGTAELKASQKESGQENGFLVAYPTEEKDYIIAMMIEKVEGRGGSTVVAEKLAKVMLK